jgi:hypothetical protein
MIARLKIDQVWQKILFPLVFLLTSPCFSQSDDKNLRSRVLDERIEFFYLHPSPERVMSIAKETAALEEFDNRYYFFSALFKTYGHQAIQWMEDAQVKLESNDQLVFALWASGLQKEALYRAQKAAWPATALMKLAGHLKQPLEFSVEIEGYLQCMTSYFLIAGDTRYISKIIDILGLTPEKVSPSFNLEELKKNAKYLLTRLMFNHELVYQRCLKESQLRSGETGRLLNELMEKHWILVKKGSLPEHNGRLNGDLLITDSPSFEEEWASLPVNSGPIGKAISSIPYPKGGQEIKIIPLFSGFALDQELYGHVTYSLDIYDPEGIKVESFEEKLGLQRQVPSRSLVQAAEDLIVMQCYDSKNLAEKPEGCSYLMIKPGLYKIQAIIKDQIGNKELIITKTLEILPP